MTWIIRVLFLIASAVIGWNLASSYHVIGAGLGTAMALFFIIVEIWFTRKFVAAISVVMFGLFIGFVLSNLLLNAFTLLPTVRELIAEHPNLKSELEFAVTFLLCYLSIIAIIQTKDDFKFIIPFVELKREGLTGEPLVLDTSVIIDGRIAEVLKTWPVGLPIIVPRFVLVELQSIADSADRSKRRKGRHGLDILNEMNKNNKINITINEASIDHIDAVDAKLVYFTKSIGGKLVTTDYNLNKISQLQEVEVININDLVNALKPVVLQGEAIELKIIRPGEEHNQGIGYLDDGTMVVVENGYHKLGQKIKCVVTNSLQTTSGRMVFAKPVQYGKDEKEIRDKI